MARVVALLVLSLLALSLAVDVEKDGDVLVLTQSNFDQVVNEAELILVEFYAPWCGHCKKLAPEYSNAAQQLKNKGVQLAKVDATVESNLGNRFNVRGYPTLKIFRKGTASEYKGPRDAAGIVSYMLKQVGPSAKPLNTVDEFNKFTENRDISIVGFFPSKSGSAYQTFLKAADQLRDDFRFALVTEKSIMDEAKMGQSIVIFKTFDDKQPVVYAGSDSVNDVSEWIYTNSLPLVGELTKENIARYKKKDLPVLKVYFDVDFGSNLKRTNYFINRIKKVAQDKDIQQKLLFAVVKRKDFKDEMDKFGLKYDDEVGVAIDDLKNLKWRFNEEFSVENLKKFVNDFLAGKIKPYIRSQPIPEPNDEAVKVVVGETFNDIVMDKSKDVLIEMYAPWCGHCKKLEPEYKSLAEKLKDVPSVVVAKMDATVNDSPHSKYQASGYPTILFAPANNKDNPIPYKGERTVDAMYSFIKEKSALPFKNTKDEL